MIKATLGSRVRTLKPRTRVFNFQELGDRFQVSFQLVVLSILFFKIARYRYLSWKHNVKSIARRVLYTDHPSVSQNTMAYKNKRKKRKGRKERKEERKVKQRLRGGDEGMNSKAVGVGLTI